MTRLIDSLDYKNKSCFLQALDISLTPARIALGGKDYRQMEGNELALQEVVQTTRSICIRILFGLLAFTILAPITFAAFLIKGLCCSKQQMKIQSLAAKALPQPPSSSPAIAQKDHQKPASVEIDTKFHQPQQKVPDLKLDEHKNTNVQIPLFSDKKIEAKQEPTAEKKKVPSSKNEKPTRRVPSCSSVYIPCIKIPCSEPFSPKASSTPFFKEKEVQTSSEAILIGPEKKQTAQKVKIIAKEKKPPKVEQQQERPQLVKEVVILEKPLLASASPPEDMGSPCTKTAAIVQEASIADKKNLPDQKAQIVRECSIELKGNSPVIVNPPEELLGKSVTIPPSARFKELMKKDRAESYQTNLLIRKRYKFYRQMSQGVGFKEASAELFKGLAEEQKRKIKAAVFKDFRIIDNNVDTTPDSLFQSFEEDPNGPKLTDLVHLMRAPRVDFSKIFISQKKGIEIYPASVRSYLKVRGFDQPLPKDLASINSAHSLICDAS